MTGRSRGRSRGRANIGRRTRHAHQLSAQRRSQSDEQRAQVNEHARANRSRSRATSADSQRPINIRSDRVPRRLNAMENAAFNYDCNADYSECGRIGIMGDRCRYCDALKFAGETEGMCCAKGKVKLPTFEAPPEPLRSLIFSGTPQSKDFLKKIRSYNSAFQMTSFGATNIIRDNFMLTFKVITSNGISTAQIDMRNEKTFNVFKNSDPSSNYIAYTLQIQGQVYHRTGSLLPFVDAEHQFLQIYFIGDQDAQIDRRCAVVANTTRAVIAVLQRFFEGHNELVRLFKTALDRMPSDDHKIVIKADRTPFGEHSRRFNAPTIDEVAIVIVGDQFQSRDIILHRRNEVIQRVSELHRSYDALQYPILHWRGDDGYHINIPMIDPTTGKLIKYELNANSAIHLIYFQHEFNL